MVDGGSVRVKKIILAFVLALLAATSAIAEDKMCITKQWYGCESACNIDPPLGVIGIQN
jgi:hypothetical protein